MKVHRSNRVERLLDALVEVVAEPVPDPLQPECIVVQSGGMATWLSMQLSQRFGVFAGADFPFPRRFVHGVFEAVLDEPASGIEAFTGPRMLWTILAELEAHLEHPAFAEVARFVADDPRQTQRFDLARRIATVFDQYLIFRPDLVLGWEDGRDDHWQAQLWRAVSRRQSARGGCRHIAALARDLFATLSRPGFEPAGLPSRVCVFGLSTLPPFYVDILAALGRHIQVHLFVISPSREYWAELRSAKAAPSADPVETLEQLEHVPPLLASLGTVGRDFQYVLESQVDYDEDDRDLYVEPDDRTLLGALQANLLHLHPGPPAGPSGAEGSIAVHACHSPMREVEVLHDQILDRLAADPQLQPRDIVVMMSDVERYAPLVEAVFERDPNDPTFVPYCISDRPLRTQSPPLEAFFRVLDLIGSRVTASEVLDLLTLEPIQRRFGIGSEDVDTITGWVADSGIRWGIDAVHRKQHGQPKLEANTWQFGLHRMLLGYALDGRERETFAQVLPYDEIEGQQAVLLGSLAQLCDRLFTRVVDLERPRDLRQWQRDLSELAEALIDESAPGSDLQPLRGVLELLCTEAEAAGFDQPLPLPALRSLLEERIEDDLPPRGFLAGGVTFCAMLPMRSVPFDVVCLLGLSDTAFPRSDRKVGFDLIAQQPRRADRSRRADDRYLFLEAVLAARRCLLAFYVGQSIQDNAELPPSVVLSELLEELARLAGAEDSVQWIRDMVVRHPMQPFSPRYFRRSEGDDPRLFSFESGYCSGAAALLDNPTAQEHAPLLTRPLPELVTGTTSRELPLSTLIRFFRLPAAELLKRRLQVHLDDWSRDRSDREPMDLGPLDAWKVGDAILEHARQGIDPTRSLELLQAAGMLPLGTPARVKHEDIERIVDPIVATARALCDAPPRPRLDVDVRVGTTALVGTLAPRWPAGIIAPQFARCGAKHLLAAWIRHLALCAVAPEDQELRTIIVARADRGGGASVARFGPVSDSTDRLAELVELYWQGQREPLLLFPKASRTFCETLAQQPGDVGAALGAARRTYEDNRGGEGNDPHLQRLFADADVLAVGYTPFDTPLKAGDFPTLSVQVFGPLLAALEIE